MTKRQESKDMQSMFNDESTAEWMEEHRIELRKSISGQYLLYQSLVIGFVIGLAAHIGGYYLLLAAPSGFLGLLADLLHALGWSLWTGVVVAVFVEIIPEAKRRQIKQALEAYEAVRREQARKTGKHSAATMEKPHAPRQHRTRKDG